MTTSLTVPVSAEPSVRLSVALRALADPNRLHLLALVRDSGGEACVCDLTAATGLAQATVSHHLATLVRAGLLHREKRGSWAWYRADPAQLSLVSEGLLDLVRATPGSRAHGACS